jgi:cytochrome c oxidase subunit 1
MGWAEPNFWSTIGAFMLGFGILAVVIQIIITCRSKNASCASDPWDSRTLEWETSSPPAVYNFAYTPVIHSRDQAWENKYGEPSRKMEKIQPDSHGIHMPDQSWWPLVVSIGLFIAGMGIIFHGQPLDALLPFLPFAIDVSLLHICVPGLVLTFYGILMWALEGPGGYHLHPQAEDLDDQPPSTANQGS